MIVNGQRAVFLAIAIGITLAGTGCRQEHASVEQLYTTRMLGLSYLQRNQLAEAESSFKQLTKLAPDDPLGYANLGLTYLQAGRLEEAENQLKRARELDPKDAEIGLALAKVYSLSKRPQDAKQLLETLRRDSTANLHVLYALAELEQQSRDSGATRRYMDRLREVLAAAPSNVAVRVQLLNALVSTGQADSAVHQLEEIRRIPPELPREARVCSYFLDVLSSSAPRSPPAAVSRSRCSACRRTWAPPCASRPCGVSRATTCSSTTRRAARSRRGAF